MLLDRSLKSPLLHSRWTAATLLLLALVLPGVAPAQQPVFFDRFELEGRHRWLPVVTPELCDGLDDDANGYLDEVPACFPAP